MQIVIGRGKNRKVTELPHGSIFAQAAKTEPDQYKQALANIVGIILPA